MISEDVDFDSVLIDSNDIANDDIRRKVVKNNDDDEYKAGNFRESKEVMSLLIRSPERNGVRLSVSKPDNHLFDSSRNRQRGRPRTRWMDRVKVILTNVDPNATIEDADEVAKPLFELSDISFHGLLSQ